MTMENIGASLIAVVVLLAANAFFVAAEFALVKVRGFQLDEATAHNRRAAALSSRMHGNLDAYLAACQLGITMASLGLGWVGEPAVAALLEPGLSKIGITGPALHTISFVVGFLLFSSLHIVIGEQVPKTYAIRKPTPVTLALAYPLHWFYLLVYPLNWLLDRANAAILRLLGVRGGLHHEVISEDEISAIVDKSEAHGEIEQKTAELIQKAFRFDDEVVRHVMVPWTDVDKLRFDDPPEKKESILANTLHSRYPVLDTADNVVGILATKDLTSLFLERNTNVWDSLHDRLRPPLVVPGSLLISRLLEHMRTTRTHMAIVTNEHGTYIGAVTLEDMLEEIIGEIGDEWDTESVEVPIERTISGWNVSGKILLTTLESEIGLALEAISGVSTLAGYVITRLERIPEEGDQFSENDFTFRITRMDGRRVGSVLITSSKRIEANSGGRRLAP
jgi:CBS domain containing-hemolysin-like protein